MSAEIDSRRWAIAPTKTKDSVLTLDFLHNAFFLIHLASNHPDQHIADWAAFWWDFWEREFERPVLKAISQPLFPEYN